MIKDSIYHTLMCLTVFQEILQDHNSFFGGKGFRVELDAPDRKLDVAQAHDFVFFRSGGDRQAVGQGRRIDEE